MEWLRENWLNIVVPVLIFIACYVVGLWVRRVAYRAFNRWVRKVHWGGGQLVSNVTRTPFIHWFWFLGIYIAVEVSVLSPDIKVLVERTVASLFIVSVAWVIANLTGKFCRRYTGKIKRLQSSTVWLVNTVRTVIGVIGALIVLEIWGAPTIPIILALFAVILIAALASRNLVVNLFSGFQLARGEHIEVDDFVRLETGEEGYIVDITWRTTKIRTLDGHLLLVPNGRLMQSTVMNYGRPLKKACDPFQFYSMVHLKELTGLKARNLAELAAILKRVPDSVVYYHTHHFLEEHQYLVPEPANDFALWVTDALGDEALGEKLASIDTFGFPTLGALRSRILHVIEDYLEKNPDTRNAMEGGEFHFIKSICVIFPTPYIVHDLREFVEVLRKVSIGSLHYHIFEARLRFKRGVNDFSIWMDECLEDKDLAASLAYLDPYNYTLEGLRTAIIQLIEKRIK
jgi:small-conductance mechanosensitive channel